MKQPCLRALIRGAAFALLVSVTSPALAQKAIIVVRHAEKVDESADPLLSAVGTARAEALAKALASLEVKGVYVTQYQRTELTAAASVPPVTGPSSPATRTLRTTFDSILYPA